MNIGSLSSQYRRNYTVTITIIAMCVGCWSKSSQSSAVGNHHNLDLLPWCMIVDHCHHSLRRYWLRHNPHPRMLPKEASSSSQSCLIVLVTIIIKCIGTDEFILVITVMRFPHHHNRHHFPWILHHHNGRSLYSITVTVIFHWSDIFIIVITIIGLRNPSQSPSVKIVQKRHLRHHNLALWWSSQSPSCRCEARIKIIAVSICKCPSIRTRPFWSVHAKTKDHIHQTYSLQPKQLMKYKAILHDKTLSNTIALSARFPLPFYEANTIGLNSSSVDKRLLSSSLSHTPSSHHQISPS